MRSFAQLFGGRTDCFGIYRVFEQRSDGKQKGKGITYPNEHFPLRVLEEADWDQHLRGKHMLGIVPVLPNATCSWFAIDVDDYSISHKKIVVEIEKAELPLVVTRSKSGGAHLYCFVDGFIQAKLAIDLGKKWAAALGYPRSEVFPKQAKFDSEEAKGNWIIVPYFGGDKAVDFGISLEGERLSVEDFTQWANAKQISPEEAQNYLDKQEQKPADMSKEDILKHTPPCIVSFFKDGIPDGGRNNSFFHLAVYYQKLDEFFGTSNWKDNLLQANQDYAEPALTYEELNQIVRNTSPVGKYQYLCKQQPMCSLCDKESCLKRKFGVGEDKTFYGDMEIISMIKVDSRPPIWIPRVNGVDVEMDTDTLLSPRKFRMAIADVLNILVPQTKQGEHDSIIGPIMQSALTIEPMDELTGVGKVMKSFTEWTKNMVTKSRSILDLEKGLPYYNPKEDAIYFRGVDFINEYKRVYKDNATERGIWACMRTNGFMRKQQKFGSKPEWIWYYPIMDDERWFETETKEKF